MLCCVNARPAPVPAPAGRQSELIAGNEFLKLLLNHDAPQRSLHSDEELEEGGRQSSARSLEHKSRYRNAHAQQEAQKNKQVVKLVTTGSKIVFLEDAPASKIKPKSKDEVKVVAVSVSSSSKRGGRISRNQQQPGSYQRSSSSPSAAGIDFVNRSHKSELTIEESEPRVAPDVMDAESDSLNSASNIQNVLAAPLLAAAASSRSSSAVAYRTGRNATEAATATATATAVDDKLLPFQTVIYHDSKQGHGPQSRSISYSSISQHVDDLQLTGGGWQRSAGILAEAQRNPNANPSQDYQQRPCWEQQQQQQHQQRQHSSLSLQHSNQNAKGLPNRDLVKCVAKFAHQQHQQQHAAPAAAAAAISAYSYSSSSSSTSSSSSAAVAAAAAGAAAPSLPHFTTERAELYTPTPEQNYEIEESVSVMTNGRAHGVQAGGVSGGSSSISNSPLSTTASPVTTTTRARNRGIDRGRGTVVYNANANANDYDGDGDGEDANNGEGDGDGGAEDEDKVAYVVEGRNYRKYRVEEKTDDGFIVGEYGVVDHNDGNLSGVRYTADSTIDRSLIQKALLTFLKLK
ncbi:CG15544 [Drosophila busckii]|uniref:CG15544 n=1 Tax=Drosophila busckii TaxID=30019 RepID=A0A0M4ETD7_DROBS|nr:CG15544 [Drosophila busckii]